MVQCRPTVGESPTSGHHAGLEPGVVDRAAEPGQRVDRPTSGSTRSGSCHSQPGLVLLAAAVVVEREQDGAALRGRRSRGRPPTCRSSCRSRASASRRVGTDAAGLVEREALVGRHEAARRLGEGAAIGVHRSTAAQALAGSGGEPSSVLLGGGRLGRGHGLVALDGLGEVVRP